jgi:hypothetical protein
MTDTSTPTWPWPFPYWDGTKLMMPLDFMTPQERKEWMQNSKQTSTLDDFPEALL